MIRNLCRRVVTTCHSALAPRSASHPQSPKIHASMMAQPFSTSSGEDHLARLTKCYVTDDGVEILGDTITRKGSQAHHDAFTAVFVHGNGFCRQTWDAIVEDMLTDVPFSAVSFDLRGHGGSGDIRGHPTWEQFRDDTIAVATSVKKESVKGGRRHPVVGVGHSMGSTCLLMAQLQDPTLFDALFLIEPIIFPPKALGEASVSPATGARYADMARKRRATFASMQAASEYFHKRLSTWDSRAVSGYVKGSFKHDTSGNGVSLRASPEQEVKLYTMNLNTVWDHLKDIRIPTVFVHGSRSWSHGDAMMAAMADEVGGPSRVISVDGASHVVNMEVPTRVATDAVEFFRQSLAIAPSHSHSKL
eukprot:Opistho-2@6946